MRNYKRKLTDEQKVRLYELVPKGLTREGMRARLKEIQLEPDLHQHAMAWLCIREKKTAKIVKNLDMDDIFTMPKEMAEYAKAHPGLEWDTEINVWKHRR